MSTANPDTPKLLKVDNWARLISDVRPGPWKAGTLIQIHALRPRYSSISSPPTKPEKATVDNTEYKIKRWKQVTQRVPENITSEKYGRTAKVIPYSHLVEESGREELHPGDKVKLQEKSYDFIYQGVKYTFNPGRKGIIVDLSSRMLGGHTFKGNHKESVWNVEFGLEKTEWVCEEFKYRVPPDKVSTANVRARDIPRISETSIVPYDLW